MGLLSSLFGGSKSSSGGESESSGFSRSSGTSTSGSTSASSQVSGNKAFGTLEPLLIPAVGGGVKMFSQGANELAGGFDGYKDNAGFNFLMDRGMGDITSGAAAKGLLRSGGTMKGLQKFGTSLMDTFYNNYLDKVGNFASLGLGAASPVVGAGSYSTGQSNSNSFGNSQNDSYSENLATSSEWSKGKNKGGGIIGTLGSLF